MKDKIIAFGLVVVLLLSVTIGTASALSNSGGGDWSYYKEITIKENSGKSLMDFQVLVELNPANFPANAKSDGSDLRFEDASGKELNYWIEEWDYPNKAKVWVKVPSIPANGKTKIKMYYGNEKANAVSDGDNVFELFDDYTDEPKWVDGLTTVTVEQNLLRFYSDSLPNGPLAYREFNTINYDVVVEWKAQEHDSSTNSDKPNEMAYIISNGEINSRDYSRRVAEIGFYPEDGTNWCCPLERSVYALHQKIYNTPDFYHWYIFRVNIKLSEYHLDYFVYGEDYSLLGKAYNKNFPDATMNSLNRFYFGDGTCGGITDNYVKWIRIRKYASTEPTPIKFSPEYPTTAPTLTTTPTPAPTPIIALSNAGGGDWKYYKEITIKENSGEYLRDYQVLVELNSANFDFSKAKSDGSDIRFSADGEELNYWIEEWNAGAKKAKIWIKVPSIPANGERKIKMYYGNPSASAVSDGDKVFEFFDDFEEGYVKGWYLSGEELGMTYPGYTKITSENPKKGDYSLKLHDISSDSVPFVRKNLSGDPKIAIEFWNWCNDVGWNGGCVFCVAKDIEDRYNKWNFNFGAQAYTNGNLKYINNQFLSETYNNWISESIDFSIPVPYSTKTWHKIRLGIDGPNGKIKLWVDEKYRGKIDFPPTIEINSFYSTVSWHAPTGTIEYLDDFRISKYASPEPTFFLSPEIPTTKPTPAITPTPTPPTPPSGKIKAVWLYNPDKYDTSTLMTDLKSAGINTVFLSTDVNNIWKYERFVKSAHENGIEVHAMILEDPRCALKENHASSIKAVETVLDYNDKSLAKFDGINIDTEPYVDLDLEQVWQDYITLLEAIHEKTKEKTVLSADIPRWYDESKIKDLAPNVDFFVIMAYDSGGAGWNTASEIEDAVASEMGAIRGEGLDAVIGIGVHEGFEDKEAVGECVDGLYEYYTDDNAFRGVSIFKYASYSGLAGAPEVPVPAGRKVTSEPPGFEAVFAIAGLLAVSYVLRRKK